MRFSPTCRGVCGQLPLHAGTLELVKRLESADLNGLYRLGVTVSADIGSRLSTLLPKRRDEDDRTIIIEALARLRAAESVARLAQRYAAEDQDCRWATVKAMAYIGGDHALGVLKLDCGVTVDALYGGDPYFDVAKNSTALHVAAWFAGMSVRSAIGVRPLKKGISRWPFITWRSSATT